MFKWLAEESRHEQVKTVVIGGDLTDAKDYHPSSLTNRLVAELDDLRRVAPRVEILLGNHDYLRDGHAYFSFLSRMDGLHFITSPYEDGDQGGPLALFLPYTKSPARDWAGMDFTHFSYVFMHQTAPGSVASNGQKMDGEALPSLKGPKVYSGDIHVPQVCGDIEYIGSPYHVHFGDRFAPRAVLLDRKGRPHDLHYPAISRFTLLVDSLEHLKREGADLKLGDQVKLRIKLAEAEKHGWLKIRREAVAWLRSRGVEVCDVELTLSRTQRRLVTGTRADMVQPRESPAEAVLRYVLREELGGDALDMGLELVK